MKERRGISYSRLINIPGNNTLYICISNNCQFYSPLMINYQDPTHHVYEITVLNSTGISPPYIIDGVDLV